MKYIIEQLGEHYEKQNAVIFRKVILVGKPATLLKKVFVLCIQVCGKLCFCMCESVFCDVEYRFKSF